MVDVGLVRSLPPRRRLVVSQSSAMALTAPLRLAHSLALRSHHLGSALLERRPDGDEVYVFPSLDFAWLFCILLVGIRTSVRAVCLFLSVLP